MRSVGSPAGSEKERPIVTTSVVDDAALTAADRCDRCGAQAYVRVTLPGGSELLFCAHHGKEHADKLKQVALKIQDETSKIS
jgi:hypothetical protein